jgi:hypothetical protein
MSVETMKQALDALEGWAGHGKWIYPESALEQAKKNTSEAIPVLRAAIQQAEEQEPVAWMYTNARGRTVIVKTNTSPFEDAIPLYTAPPQREWQGLTEEEIIIMSRYNLEYAALIGEVQGKLKEKNTCK